MVMKKDEMALFAGDVFLAEYDATTDALGGERGIGHVPSFAISAPAITEIEEKGAGRDDFGETIFTMVTEIAQEAKITSKSMNRKNLAMEMFGEDSVYTQEAGNNTATPADVTAYIDLWSPLGKRNLDPSMPPVVKDDSDATTYVENTDYKIDYQAGRIKPLAGQAITEADVLHVGSTWLETTGYNVKANLKTDAEYFLRLVGTDKANGLKCEVIIKRCKIKPAGDIAWIMNELKVIELTVTMLKVGSDPLWETFIF